MLICPLGEIAEQMPVVFLSSRQTRAATQTNLENLFNNITLREKEESIATPSLRHT